MFRDMSSTTRTLLIGCGAMVVTCCACTLLALALTGGAIGAVIGIVGEIVQGPYDVATRPLPIGSSADDLLPLMIGPYERSAVYEDADAYRVTYSGQGVEIQVRASHYMATSLAQQAVQAVANETENSGASERSVATGIDPSYVRIISGSRARMAWNRGPYFFDVQTSSETTLDTFMEAFPY
ncbi:MAG: hypothetical protein JW910_06240 [Anaerolineae bacterium]|nr:hypothetical protein [Anaerolineae bacterium]